MKVTIVTLFIIGLTCRAGVAGTGYDACLQAEQKLRATEAESCSGFTKVVNPSGCISAQKALREYDAGKCRKIGEQERGLPINAQPTNNAERVNVNTVPKAKEPVTVTGQTELEKLQAENARLKAEIARLKAEQEVVKCRGE